VSGSSTTSGRRSRTNASADGTVLRVADDRQPGGLDEPAGEAAKGSDGRRR
jgi:hypothetical protein